MLMEIDFRTWCTRISKAKKVLIIKTSKLCNFLLH